VGVLLLWQALLVYGMSVMLCVRHQAAASVGVLLLWQALLVYGMSVMLCARHQSAANVKFLMASALTRLVFAVRGCSLWLAAEGSCGVCVR
jgi:hypothetical protein